MVFFGEKITWRKCILGCSAVLCISLTASGCAKLDAGNRSEERFTSYQPLPDKVMARKFKSGLREITGSRDNNDLVQPILVGLWLSPSKRACLLAIKDVFAEKDMGRVYNIYWMDDTDVSYVHTYQRSVEVTWSPSGRLFFINDHFASNGSNCFIFDGENGNSIVDLEERLRKSGTKEYKIIPSKYSCHISGTSWQQDDVLLLQITGWESVDDDATIKPYTYEGSYDLKRDELMLRVVGNPHENGTTKSGN